VNQVSVPPKDKVKLDDGAIVMIITYKLQWKLQSDELGNAKCQAITAQHEGIMQSPRLTPKSPSRKSRISISASPLRIGVLKRNFSSSVNLMNLTKDQEHMEDLQEELVGEKEESKEDGGNKSLNSKEDGITMSPSLEKKSINLSTNSENIENPSESPLIPASPKETPKGKKVLASHTREKDNTDGISTQGSEQTNEKNQLTPHRKSSRLFQKGNLNGRLLVM